MEIVKPNKKGLEKAVEILKKGGIIVYPTETAYAIGADITKKKALRRIYKLKKRPRNKPLTAIVSDINMAKEYCYLTKLEEEIVKKYMPGALTLIAKKKKKVPDEFNKKNFGFRISSNKIARKLAKMLGKPITATSANISGEKEVYDPKKLKINADLLIDAGKLKRRKTSTIIKVVKGKIKVLREGAIKLSVNK
ncbi:MAG: threonylcarbamoyl-AMP synthase [Nanoarchaeota archaeon]|nr:threonylcarbamoyl-AMP synthase [Nanoarchaeota archaeon]